MNCCSYYAAHRRHLNFLEIKPLLHFLNASQAATVHRVTVELIHRPSPGFLPSLHVFLVQLAMPQYWHAAFGPSAGPCLAESRCIRGNLLECHYLRPLTIFSRLPASRFSTEVFTSTLFGVLQVGGRNYWSNFGRHEIN